jgi:hypothetical protein
VIAPRAPSRIRVAARFEGPPGAANGGYVAGLLAGRGPARVTIRRPVPVETDLDFDGATLRDAAGVALAELSRLDEVDVGEIPPVSVDAARVAAAATPLAARHPFPNCFGCGPMNEHGLHCLAGPVNGEVWAVAWTPEDFAPELVWSALDCTSCGPVVEIEGEPAFVLGRIEAEIRADVVPGREHAVVAWKLADDGRRRQAASALCAEDGTLVAAARATWFALR